MNILLTLSIVSLISAVGLVGTVSAEGNILPQYISGNVTQDNNNNGCPENSDADFCFDENDDINDGKDEGFHTDDNDKGVYACNVITDTDKFCKENLERNDKKQQDSKKDTPSKAKITVGYGSVGSYYGKGKVVITNEDTGETLVNKKLNFAKQHHNQGPDCCVKVYKFDKSEVDRGDDISVKVTAAGGSWETAPYDYKKNLRISITLDEIGE